MPIAGAARPEPAVTTKRRLERIMNSVRRADLGIEVASPISYLPQAEFVVSDS